MFPHTVWVCAPTEDSHCQEKLWMVKLIHNVIAKGLKQVKLFEAKNIFDFNFCVDGHKIDFFKRTMNGADGDEKIDQSTSASFASAYCPENQKQDFC